MHDVRVLPVHVEPRPHDVLLGVGLLERLGAVVAGVVQPARVALVTDDNVAVHHLEPAEAALRAEGFDPLRIVVPAGEGSKSVAECERLWGLLAEGGVDRTGAVIALGGGVVGDLAGFVAATWMRGVALVQVPTTVLAMADAAIGGKVGVNLPSGKNLVGAFHLPHVVVADVATLATLGRRDVAAGLGEVVKCAVLSDRAALAALRDGAAALLAGEREPLTAAVALAAACKVRVVTADPWERTGERTLLNLGHTVGHALEAERGYGDLRHGEAVAVGLVVAARLAAARGVCDADLVTELAATLAALGLPTALLPGAEPDAVVAWTRRDKKNAGGVRRMVLPLRDGGAAVEDVGDDELRAALR